MQSLLCFTAILLICLASVTGSNHKFDRKGDFLKKSKVREDGNGDNILRTYHRTPSDPNFINVRINKDQEKEIGIAFHRIIAMETVVPNFGENGLFFREVTDGERVIKLIYQDKGHLADCDIISGEDEVNKFVSKFYTKQQNSTTTFIHSKDSLDEASRELLDFKTLRRSCRTLHHYIRKEYRKAQRHNFQSDRQHKRSHSPEEMTGKSRSKRSSMLIYPGTKWCGKGSVSAHYEDLGPNFNTDKCCRAHDNCPYIILGFENKYNMFNYRFHTLSHCNCDVAFRACLKDADNSVAHMVGSLYFNVVGTKCFNLKPQDVCMKRSWWGSCVKQEKQYSAYIEDPLPF